MSTRTNDTVGCLAIIAFIGGVLGFCVWGLKPPERRPYDQDSTMKWEKVYRIFMHDPQDYSLMVELTPGRPELTTIKVRNHPRAGGYPINPTFTADVVKGNPRWPRLRLGALV